LLNMRPEASREEFLVRGRWGTRLRRNRSKDFSEASFGWTFNARAVRNSAEHPIVGASRHSHAVRSDIDKLVVVNQVSGRGVIGEKWTGKQIDIGRFDNFSAA